MDLQAVLKQAQSALDESNNLLRTLLHERRPSADEVSQRIVANRKAFDTLAVAIAEEVRAVPPAATEVKAHPVGDYDHNEGDGLAGRIQSAQHLSIYELAAVAEAEILHDTEWVTQEWATEHFGSECEGRFVSTFSPEVVLKLLEELKRLSAECKALGEFVIACGGFWGKTKSVLVGPDSLHAVIEAAFADAAELEKLRTAEAATNSSQAKAALEQCLHNHPHTNRTRTSLCNAIDAIGKSVIRPAVETDSFQERVQAWVLQCLGEADANSKVERNFRFFEESVELVQACGMSAEECHKLVDYVYSRPIGDIEQEIGGVMVTLACLCAARELDMQHQGNQELLLINCKTMMDAIRAKQATKPHRCPTLRLTQNTKG